MTVGELKKALKRTRANKLRIRDWLDRAGVEYVDASTIANGVAPDIILFEELIQPDEFKEK